MTQTHLTPASSTQEETIEPEVYRIKLPSLEKLTFDTIFMVTFCISGLLTIISPVPYRMGIMSLIILPLATLKGLRLTKVFFLYSVLTLEIIISALYNQSPIFDVVEFMRILVFSYLIYYLTEAYLKAQNIIKVLKLCIIIAIIQLPVIILQWSLYPQIPEPLKTVVVPEDFGFGTFNFKTDYAMCIFLTFIIVFLLFDSKRNYFVRYKWPILVWLSITVLVANAQIVKVILILVWCVYVITHLRIKTLLIVAFVSGMVLVITLYLSSTGILTENVTTFIQRINPQTTNAETYLTGGYARFGALSYYIDQPISWLGDGPGKYNDAISRQLFRGNTGHIYTFYSEIGLLGWVLSVLIFFFIAFPQGSRTNYIRITWSRILIFIAINILSFTSQVMNDIAVMFIYCIMANIHLISVSGGKGEA